MKHIPFKKLIEMPWKNGQGSTFELFIYPENSKLALLDFSFRISMAKILSNNNFSVFPQYNRFLTVVEGSGIKFNDDKILREEVKFFSGEIEVVSGPIDDKFTLDLGCIFDPSKVKVNFSIEKKTTIDFTEGIDFLFIIPLEFNMNFSEFEIQKWDALLLEKGDQVAVLNFEQNVVAISITNV